MKPADRLLNDKHIELQRWSTTNVPRTAYKLDHNSTFALQVKAANFDPGSCCAVDRAIGMISHILTMHLPRPG